jgi:ATP-binding cassette subfamily F protein 3
MAEYLAKKREEHLLAHAVLPIKSLDNSKATAHAARQEEQARKKIKEKEVRSVKRQLEAVEAEIAHFELRKNEIEKLLADPELYKKGEEAKAVSAEYKSIEKGLSDAYWRWGKVSEELEKVQAAE